jgi:hypothetical protein
MLWEVNKETSARQYQQPSVTPINSKHTSRILSIQYHENSQTLYSGGADGKLTWYNLAMGNSGSEFRIGERVSLKCQSDSLILMNIPCLIQYPIQLGQPYTYQPSQSSLAYAMVRNI